MRSRFIWQVAIAILLVLVVFSISIPTVRAALSAWLGLSLAPANQMPATSLTLVAVTPAALASTATLPASATPTPAAPTFAAAPAATSAPAQNIPPQVAQVAPQVGWQILLPGRLPEGYQFQSAYFDTNHQMLILTYQIARQLPGAADPSLTTTKTITFLQAQKNDFVPMQVAPDAAVNDVQVNGQPGVYVLGAWDTQFVPNEKDPNGGAMVSTWRNDLPIQNLYWQVGNVYLALITDDEALNQPDLLHMAGSLGHR